MNYTNNQGADQVDDEEKQRKYAHVEQCHSVSLSALAPGAQPAYASRLFPKLFLNQLENIARCLIGFNQIIGTERLGLLDIIWII